MPHRPSITARSTPKSFSMRANSERVVLRALLAGLDAPVGDAAVDVLPELLVELGLAADFREYGRVGLQAAHHARVGRVGNALRERTRAECLDPLRERLRGDLREGGCAERKRGRAAEGGFEQISAGKFHPGSLQTNRGEDSAAAPADLLWLRQRHRRNPWIIPSRAARSLPGQGPGLPPASSANAARSHLRSRTSRRANTGRRRASVKLNL